MPLLTSPASFPFHIYTLENLTSCLASIFSPSISHLMHSITSLPKKQKQNLLVSASDHHRQIVCISLHFHLVLTILNCTCHSWLDPLVILLLAFLTLYSILLTILLMKTLPRVGSKCCPWPLLRILYISAELIRSLRFKYNLLLKFPSLHSALTFLLFFFFSV